MARGPRFWALGVDSGPRGGAVEGILDPNNNKTNIFISAQTAPTTVIERKNGFCLFVALSPAPSRKSVRDPSFYSRAKPLAKLNTLLSGPLAILISGFWIPGRARKPPNPVRDGRNRAPWPGKSSDFHRACRRLGPRTGRPRWGTTSATLRVPR